MKSICRSAVTMIVLFLLAACQSGQAMPANDIEGRVLVWHSFNEQEEAVFDEILDSFAELHPAVHLTDERFSISELATVFPQQAESGLGPDIVILPASHINQLSEQGLIRDVSAAMGEDGPIDAEQFLTTSLAMVGDGEKMWGVPLSLSTFGLYYNKLLLGTPDSSAEDVATLIAAQQEAITDTVALQALDDILANFDSATAIPPASDLEQLLEQANAGQRVAMPSNFYDAFWGIQTFGGRLFDEEGRVILNQGGFANWLGWLKRAQENPNIILNRRSDTLFDLFVEGNVSYYVASSAALPALQEAMGEDVVEVVRLPGLQNRAAGPFLEVNAMLFSQASAQASATAALRLAQFLTNTEQQTEFALAAGQLPVNHNVQIDPRIAPLTAEFVAQSRTSVPIALTDRERIEEIVSTGDTFYGQVLGGETTVVAAANTLTEQLNEQYGFDTLASSVIDDCDLRGSITVWHSYTDSADATLAQIREQFLQACPETAIAIESFEPTEIVDLYVNAAADGDAPDLLLVTNRDITRLASAELIAPLDNKLDADFLQRYALGLERATRFDGSLYGVPIALDSMTLYYDTELIQDPPVVLDDILTMAADGLSFGIPIGFEESYWGVAAFGETVDSPIFDEEGRFTLGDVGLTDWLTWLQEAQTQSNIHLDRNRETLRDQFINQELALLVDDAQHLNVIRSELGVDKVAVVPLPSGAPLLEVEMLVVNPASDEESQALALQFAQSLTDVENQALLMAEAGLVPVNINVDSAEFPLIDGFARQSETAVVLPNEVALNVVLETGDLIYEETIDNEFAVADAVTAFVNIVNVANGFEVEEVVQDQDSEAGATCEDEGQLSLWHSWSETEVAAWETVIANFNAICPNIEVVMEFIPEADMTEALAETLEAGSDVEPPDLFIGRSDQQITYRELNLIKDVAALVDESQVINYLPRSVVAFRSEDALFGLPQHIDLQALYYRTDTIDEPALTLNQLLEQVEGGATLGLNASFEGLVWGGSAFGCLPCLEGNFFDDQGDVELAEDDLSGWLNYLQMLASTGNVTFAPDDESLVDRFAAGELDYVVVNSDQLNRLQDEVGAANLAALALPSGAEDFVATPYAVIRGFFFSQNVPESKTEMAIRFASYANERDSQAELLQTASYVPTNNLVIISADNPLLNPLLEELDQVVLMPDSTFRQQLREQSDPIQQFETFSNGEGE